MNRILWKGISSEERRLVTNAALVLSVPLALVVLIPILMGLAIVDRESKARANEINRSRAEITYTSCLAQNDRHDRTVRRIDEIISRRKSILREQIKEAASEEEANLLRAQIDAVDDGRSTTVSLIDSLQPVVNCDELVLSRFGFIPDDGSEQDE